MLTKLIARKFSSKIYPSAAAAISDIKDGDKLLVGGFGLVGIPANLINALVDQKQNKLKMSQIVIIFFSHCECSNFV